MTKDHIVRQIPFLLFFVKLNNFCSHKVDPSQCGMLPQITVMAVVLHPTCLFYELFVL